MAALYGVDPAYAANLPTAVGISAAAAAGARARAMAGAGVGAGVAFGRGGQAGAAQLGAAPPASKGKPGAGKKGKGGRKGAAVTAAPAAVAAPPPGEGAFPGAMPVPKMGTFHSPYVPMENLPGAGEEYRHQAAPAAPAAHQHPGRPITDLEARQIGQCLQSLQNVSAQLDSKTRDTVMHSLLRRERPCAMAAFPFSSPLFRQRNAPWHLIPCSRAGPPGNTSPSEQFIHFFPTALVCPALP